MPDDLRFSAVVRVAGEQIEVLEVADDLPAAAADALRPAQHELIRLAVRAREATLQPGVPYRLEFSRVRGRSHVRVTPL